jgi:hypothetical protein
MINTNPFPMGTTPFAGQTLDVSSSYASVPLQKLEGRECVSVDLDPSNLTKTRSSQFIKTRIVRNCSGVTLLPGRFVAYSVKNKRVNGYSRLSNAVGAGGDAAGVVDPYLSAGVADGDLFHCVVEGPCLIKTPKTGAEFGQGTNWAAGNDLVALTFTTALATTSNTVETAGRVTAFNVTFSAAETTDGTEAAQARNVLAEVISAMTSSQTNTDALVFVKIPR